VVPAGAEALSRFLGQPVLLVTKAPRLRKALKSGLDPTFDRELGLQDDGPLHILSKESVREMTRLIRSAVGTKGVSEEWNTHELDWRRWVERLGSSTGALKLCRYRPNVIVEGAGVPFAEDAWRHFTIGPTQGTHENSPITSVARMFRCTVDPSFLHIKPLLIPPAGIQHRPGHR
jgi:uncharacterized protein YcbX